MQASYNSRTPKIIGALAISGFVAVGAFVFLRPPENGTKSNTPTSSVSTSQTVPSNATTAPSTSSTATTPTTTLAVQQYTDTVQYEVPREVNSLKVTATLQNGTITAISTSHDYADPESSAFVNSFNRYVKEAVVGKKISDISLTRIGGASLTSQAFYDALQNIAQQAG